MSCNYVPTLWTTEPTLRNYWSLHTLEPCTQTREAMAKTQCSQKINKSFKVNKKQSGRASHSAERRKPVILLIPMRPCTSPLLPKHQSLTTAQLHPSQLLDTQTHTLFFLVGSKVWTRIWRWWALPGVVFHGLLGELLGGRKNSTNVTQGQGASAREKQFLNTAQIFVTKVFNFSERTAEEKQNKGKPWFLSQMTIRSEQPLQTKDVGHLAASEPCPPCTSGRQWWL